MIRCVLWTILFGTALGCVEYGPITVQVVDAVDGTVGADADPAEVDMGPRQFACTESSDCDDVCIDDTSITVCVGGFCKITSTGCADGFGDADGDPSTCCECEIDGEESMECDGIDNDCDGRADELANLDSDIANCGVCGELCGGERVALASCSAGRCNIDVCDPPWFNHDGISDTGCRCSSEDKDFSPVALLLPDDALREDDGGFSDRDGLRGPPGDGRVVYWGDGSAGTLVWSRFDQNGSRRLVTRAWRVDADGYPVGDPFTVADERASQRGLGPVFALGPERVAINWELHDGGERQVLTQRIDYAGGDPSISGQPLAVPDRYDYLLAPVSDGMRAAYLGPVVDGARQFIEVVTGAILATQAVAEGEEPDNVAPRALSCRQNGGDCLVMWQVEPSGGETTLRVNNAQPRLDDTSPGPFATLARSTDERIVAVWHTGDEDVSGARSVQLDGSGSRLGAGHPIADEAQPVSPASGNLFPWRDGFALSWPEDDNGGGRGRYIEIGGDGVPDQQTYRQLPAVASGRVDETRLYRADPPTTISFDRILTRGLPWPAPTSQSKLLAVHPAPFDPEADLTGMWIAWSGSSNTDAVFAARLEGDDVASTAARPLLVGRGVDLSSPVLMPGPDGGAILVAIGGDALFRADISAEGIVRRSVRPIVGPGGESGAVDDLEMAATPWEGEQVFVVVTGTIDGQRVMWKSVTTPDDADPVTPIIEQDAPGNSLALGGPGGEAGVLLVSWVGENEKVLEFRHIGPEGMLVDRDELGRALGTGPVSVVFSPVSGNTFVVWNENTADPCSRVLRFEIFDRNLVKLDSRARLWPDREDDPICHTWLHVAPNLGGGVSVLSGAGGADASLLSVSAEGQRIGRDSTWSAGEGDPGWTPQTALVGTTLGPVGFRVPSGHVLQHLRFGCR